MDTDLTQQVKKHEAQILKLIGNITSKASNNDTYKKLAILSVEQRRQNFAQNLDNRNLLNDLKTHHAVLKSGKIRAGEPIHTLSSKLKFICVQNTTLPEPHEFNVNDFCIWRKFVKKVTSNKAKNNKKQN